MKELTKELMAVKQAAHVLRLTEGSRKNLVLQKLSTYLKNNSADIFKANNKDLKSLSKNVSPSFYDRLALNPVRIDQMRASIDVLVKMPDPVNEVVDKQILANGLIAERVRAPIGAVFMIYESRPNVAIEAFAVGFKAGNAMALRGGKESRRTVSVLYSLIQQSLSDYGLPLSACLGVLSPSRTLMKRYLKANTCFDLVIPRGGSGLIKFVVENSNIPWLKNDRGLCHIFVDEAAEPSSAERIILNAKTSRPAVCNAVETVLVHEKAAARFLPGLITELHSRGVKIKACKKTTSYLKPSARKHVVSATAKDFHTEWLDLVINIKTVSTMNDAIAHIEEHGTRHSEAILTTNAQAAAQFKTQVNAAAVYWNASTRFTDGFELGLGGEIGISTQTLHARGPLGPRELTTPRWIITGTGQIRI